MTPTTTVATEIISDPLFLADNKVKLVNKNNKKITITFDLNYSQSQLSLSTIHSMYMYHNSVVKGRAGLESNSAVIFCTRTALQS